MSHYDKPMAAAPWKSYRYKGPYGWVMIGANDDVDAFKEAKRSLSTETAVFAHLQRWNGEEYVGVIDEK